MAQLSDLSDLAQEVSDIYAARFGINRDAVWHLAKLSEELGEVQAAYLKTTGQGRSTDDPETRKAALAAETADLFAHLLLFARWQDIDLEQAITDKWGQYAPKT